MAGGQVDWRVRGPLGEVEIELHPSSVEGEAREASLREMAQLVYDFKARKPEARRVLLELYARLQGQGPASVSGPTYELDAWSTRAEAIGARRKFVKPVVVTLGGEFLEEALGPEAEPTAWIAIELVDDEGNPVPSVDYRIECDDGRVRTGTTNWDGKAREEGLHDGNCKVSFPGLNAPDWKKVG